MLSDPDRYPARTVPPLLILAWTGTVIFCLFRESAAAAERDVAESSVAPHLGDPSKAERPHPALELRRQLQEYRRHRQRNSSRESEPQEHDGAYGTYGTSASRQRNLDRQEAVPAELSPGALAGSPFSGSLNGPLLTGSLLTGSSIGILLAPGAGVPRAANAGWAAARPGLPSGLQAGAADAPLASPFAPPLAPPLTTGLFEMWSGPAKEPVSRQRRVPTGGGAGMRLNELERALLRQQLREVLRVPGGRDPR